MGVAFAAGGSSRESVGGIQNASDVDDWHIFGIANWRTMSGKRSKIAHSQYRMT